MSDQFLILCNDMGKSQGLNDSTPLGNRPPVEGCGRFLATPTPTACRFPRLDSIARLGGGGVWIAACLLAATLGPIVGCGKSGPKTVRVTGRILLNGQPLAVTPTEAQLGAVQLRFIELGADGAPSGPSYSANAKPDGSFNVLGIGGRGLPPGNYRIAVYQYDPYPEDKLGGRFSDERSKIVRRIEADTDLGTIDLAEVK